MASSSTSALRVSAHFDQEFHEELLAYCAALGVHKGLLASLLLSRLLRQKEAETLIPSAAPSGSGEKVTADLPNAEAKARFKHICDIQGVSQSFALGALCVQEVRFGSLKNTLEPWLNGFDSI